MKFNDITKINNNVEMLNQFSKYVNKHCFNPLPKLINRDDPADNNMLVWVDTLDDEFKACQHDKWNSEILTKALNKYSQKFSKLNQWIKVITYWNRDGIGKVDIEPITKASHDELVDLMGMVLDENVKI